MSYCCQTMVNVMNGFNEIPFSQPIDLYLCISESFSERLAPNQREDDLLLSSEPSEGGRDMQPSSDHHLEYFDKNENATQISDVNQMSSGTNECQTTNDLAQVSQASDYTQSDVCISSESDLVSSTNKEDDDEIASQPTQSQSEQKYSDPCYEASADEQSENTVYDDSEVSHSEEQTDDKSESESAAVVLSQDATEDNNSEQTVEDYDHDDSEDVRERRNPKTCVERELPQPFEENNKPKQFSHNYLRNRHLRPQMPRPNHPYANHVPGGPDFNPSFMPQYRGARRPMLPVNPQYPMNMNMMRGPPNHMQQRMPPGMQPPRMPPGMIGPHPRLPRPPFQSSPAMFGNNPGMPPQGKFKSKFD